MWKKINKLKVFFVILILVCNISKADVIYMPGISYNTSETSAIIDSTNTYRRNIDLQVEDGIQYSQNEFFKYLIKEEIDGFNINKKLYEDTNVDSFYANLYDIVSRHSFDDASLVLDYILNYPQTRVFARYNINKDSTYNYSNIPCLTKENLNTYEKDYYESVVKKIIDFLPSSFVDNFKYILLDSDGESGNLASCYALDNNYVDYAISIDINDIEDLYYFKTTLVHEYFHFLSLNSTQAQLKNGKIKNTEKNYETDDRIFNKESYINLFYKLFWINEENRRKAYVGDYQANETDFVTEYAQTSLVEDIAESFYTFVVENEKPIALNYVRDKKIMFFYNFPELVKIREEFREKLF
ncbi:MAG: hypothetical protein Q4F88_03495 [Eubacteriales bacterium]|nr:hypothetical protein [Eubacteriales bacterium]